MLSHAKESVLIMNENIGNLSREPVHDQSDGPGMAEVTIRRIRTCRPQFVLLWGTFLRKTPPRKDQRTRLQGLNTWQSVLYVLQFSPTLCYKSPPRVPINRVDWWPYSSQEWVVQGEAWETLMSVKTLAPLWGLRSWALRVRWHSVPVGNGTPTTSGQAA